MPNPTIDDAIAELKRQEDESMTLILDHTTFDEERDTVHLNKLNSLCEKLSQLLKDASHEQRLQYNELTTTFLSDEWRAKIIIEFKKTFNEITIKDNYDLYNILGELLKINNTYKCRLQQKDFGNDVFLLQTTLSFLAELFSSSIIEADSFSTTFIINFIITFSLSLSAQLLASKKTPSLEEVLKQPHLIVENFITGMKKYGSKEDLLDSLQLQLTKTQKKLQSSDKLAVRAYNSFVTTCHSVLFAPLLTKPFTDFFSDLLLKPIIEPIMTNCGNGIGSALGWIGLEKIAYATCTITLQVKNALISFGGNILGHETRQCLMEDGQIPVGKPEPLRECMPHSPSSTPIPR